MRANISGIEVEGTAEEIGVLLRNYLKPTSATPATTSTSGLTCPTCGMGGFKTPATVRMHISHMKDEAHKKVRKEEPSAGTNTCDECGRSFKKVQALHHHQSAVGHARREISSAAGSSSAYSSPGLSAAKSEQSGDAIPARSSQTLAAPSPSDKGGRMLPEESSGLPNSSAGHETRPPDARENTNRYIFVCRVGPTEVRHEVVGKDPNEAIKAHDSDEANRNHRFLTALTKPVPNAGRPRRIGTEAPIR